MHYLLYCCRTQDLWTILGETPALIEANIAAEEPSQLLSGREQRTAGQWRLIGKLWADCCREILEVGEKVWTAPNVGEEAHGRDVEGLLLFIF